MRKRKKMSFKTKFIIILLIFFLAFTAAYSAFESRLSRLVSEIAENTVNSKAAIIISTAIYDEIERDDISYDKLVSFEKDDSGRITALKTNIIEVNRLKSKIAVEILSELEKMNTAELEIPLGTVIGGELFSGRGPGIKINVLPIGSVETEIENQISSAGINQSRHQIMMRVNAEVAVITAMSSVTTNVSSYICIAETVIVGDVPNSYTNVDLYGKP